MATILNCMKCKNLLTNDISSLNIAFDKQDVCKLLINNKNRVPALVMLWDSSKPKKLFKQNKNCPIKCC